MVQKMITKFDIEGVLLRKKFAGEWPEGMLGVNVYHDEVEIRVNSKAGEGESSEKLREWFGAKYNKDEKRIYLEFPGNGKKRYLEVAFELEPEGERYMPEVLKPDFASFSLYPDKPGLKGPDFSRLAGTPSIWAFYSFKGGVSRTLHLVSLVKALSEQKPPKRVLIIDADLEAPGLTWWGEEQLGEAEVSFLDFLALAHFDQSPDYDESVTITAEFLRRRMLTFETRKEKVEHFFLPAFKDVNQLMRMPIRPENVCWEKGKEWILPELLYKLGKKLDVHAVVVDLRAGLSEISSPFLFDPRVNRVIVTTPSSQSIEGTKRVLIQIEKVSRTIKSSEEGYETSIPTVILSMIKEDLRDSSAIRKAKEELEVFLLPEDLESDDLIGKEVILDSLFDENLLLLDGLKGTLEKLDGADMHQLMSNIADEFLSLPQTGSQSNKTSKRNYIEDLKKLEKVAENYEYAESGQATNFLITQNLKNIARKYENSLPVAVVMGPKGSGKTYTYLQLAYLKRWGNFIRKVENKQVAGDGFVWPFLASRNLVDEAKDIIEICRRDAERDGNLPFKKLTTKNFEDRIEKQKSVGGTDLSSWREFWLKLMAESLSISHTGDPLESIQHLLTVSNNRVVFQIDGLEDYFQQVGKDDVQKTAIRALCQSVVDAIQEWPDNKLGLIIFIRKDIVKASIEQNFSQFESRYKMLELRWNREEALRLVVWLVRDAAGLDHLIDRKIIDGPIEAASGEAIESSLLDLWGLKLGPPHSREAYTANWVISVLSDFNSQLQARDLVRLLRHASEQALKMERYPGRLLPPSSIKNALDPCSRKKIEEIGTEIRVLDDIFAKLKKAEHKELPFVADKVGLNSDDIETMTKFGVATEYEGKYYMPEIIRRGLGFKSAGRGRLKVLNLLKRSN